MHSVTVLGAELIHKSLWYPTILGVLVVIAAIVLFCGSIYLLLATNLGSRLGFLILVSALSGFMIVLSALWWTTQSPLNTFKGSIPEWKVIGLYDNLSDAKIDAVRTIEEKGREVSTTEAANVKAAVDAALVTQVAVGGVEPEPAANKWAEGHGFTYKDPTQYLVPQTWEVGGRNTHGISHFMTRFFHPPLYSVAQFCTATPIDNTTLGVPFGLPPGAYNYNPATGKFDVKKAECQEGTTKYLVLRRSLGSLRVPPMLTFIAASIVFALSLLALHWRERDEQERAAAASTPAPAGA